MITLCLKRIRTTLVAIACLLLGSCATILHQPVTTFKVHTTEPAEIVVNRQVYKTGNNVAAITTARSRDSLVLTVRTDSTENDISIPSVNSFMFYANILFNYGIGMLVDMTNEKRFTYPANVYFNHVDSRISFKRPLPEIKKGSTYLIIAVPYINHFYLVPEGESSKTHAGFWGLSVGLDYFYSKYSYLSVKASVAIDYLVPFPVGVDFSGEIESAQATYITLSNSHRIKKFSIGYGLSFSRNSWSIVYHDRFNPPPPVRAPVSKTRSMAGLTFPIQYQAGKKFVIGLNYMPSLVNLSDEMKLHYEHLLSFDFGWKLNLRSRTNPKNASF